MTTRSAAEWAQYLERFHADAPGITEDVLRDARASGITPHRWLVDGLDPHARIVDVGCGSGPARPTDATGWVGIDRSAGELERAVAEGRRPVVRADATRLPVATGRVDAVTAAMSLMLVAPLGAALDEARRVIGADGELRLLLPARGPLTAADRLRYLRLFWAARSVTQWPPTELRRHARSVLARHGFDVIADERRRFDLEVDTAHAARRYVGSWYLPDVGPRRRAAVADASAAMVPFRIGVPLRRVIARPC